MDAQLEPLPSARARLLRGLTRRGTQWLVVGSVLGGLGAYLFQIVGTRALGEEAYAPIGTLWTIQFLTWSIFLQPVESFVTREVVTGRAAPSLSRTVAVRTWAWVALVAATVAGTSWLAGERLFFGVEGLAVIAGLIALSFGAFAFVRGGLAGHERFRAYGFVSAAESLLRLALAVVVVLIVPTTRALAWTMPFGAAIAASFWFVVRGDPGEPPAGVPEGLGQSRAGRFLVLTSVANAAGQLLLAGGPLALVALAAAPSELSVFFVTITAARVPVVLALGGLLSRLLPTFGRILAARGRDVVPGLAARIAVGTVAVAAVGAALGFAAGQPAHRPVLWVGVRTAPMARGDRGRRRAHRDRRDGPQPAAGGRRSRAPAPDPVDRWAPRRFARAADRGWHADAARGCRVHLGRGRRTGGPARRSAMADRRGPRIDPGDPGRSGARMSRRVGTTAG